MIDLRQRSSQKELMDADNIPFADMAKTLQELNNINTYLGGHSITLQGVNQLKENNKHLTICEIGCGGGDNLSAIYKHFKRRNLKINFIGIDINPECIAFAKEQHPQLACQWICSDYSNIHFEKKKPDIIFSSLFCHHFTNEQLVQMIKWLQLNSKKGFFMNDLQRHWLAWYLIKYITKFFRKSYLVKNDAALSVARSFRKNDWDYLFKDAGINNYSIKWKWAFRYLVTVKNNG